MWKMWKIIRSKIQETMMLEDLRSLLIEIKLIKNYVLPDWENNRSQASSVCDELCITSLRFLKGKSQIKQKV